PGSVNTPRHSRPCNKRSARIIGPAPAARSRTRTKDRRRSKYRRNLSTRWKRRASGSTSCAPENRRPNHGEAVARRRGTKVEEPERLDTLRRRDPEAVHLQGVS